MRRPQSPADALAWGVVILVLIVAGIAAWQLVVGVVVLVAFALALAHLTWRWVTRD